MDVSEQVARHGFKCSVNFEFVGVTKTWSLIHSTYEFKCLSTPSMFDINKCLIQYVVPSSHDSAHGFFFTAMNVF